MKISSQKTGRLLEIGIALTIAVGTPFLTHVLQ